MVSGCTSQEQSQPSKTQPTIATTTQPSPIETVIAPSPTITTEVNPALEGIWYLKLMSDQNGTALVQMINPQMSVVFDGNSNISGYSGCNNYQGTYTLTGKTDKNGYGITIAPLVATKQICADSETTERTYLQILQSTSSYLVNVNQELSMMDNSGNTLVYQRTPYNEDAVPANS